MCIAQRLSDQPVGALCWKNCKRKDTFSSPAAQRHYRAAFHQVLLPPTLKLPRLPDHALTCASGPLYFKNNLSYTAFLFHLKICELLFLTWPFQIISADCWQTCLIICQFQALSFQCYC